MWVRCRILIAKALLQSASRKSHHLTWWTNTRPVSQTIEKTNRNQTDCKTMFSEVAIGDVL